jgi:hypothetical protein
LGSVRQTFDNVDTRVGPLTSSLEKTSDSAGVAAQHARVTLDTVNTAIAPGSPLNYQALQTLQDLSAAGSDHPLVPYPLGWG